MVDSVHFMPMRLALWLMCKKTSQISEVVSAEYDQTLARTIPYIYAEKDVVVGLKCRRRVTN